ncbi:MAG: hypothetical protein WA510_02100 [Acidobacteriaceae bacterium]
MSDSGPEVLFEVRVRWEIWESFVSLLRSYAALAGADYTVQNFSDWAMVEHNGRTVRFCFDPLTGEAVWRKVQSEFESWGSFHINDDGTLQFDDGSRNLDMSVIDWIEWLGQEGPSNLSFMHNATSPGP